MKFSARWFSWFRLALLLAFFGCHTPSGQAVLLLWDPSPSTNVAGYAVYYGYNSGDYSTRLDVGNQLSFSFQPEAGRSNYFFVVTAYTPDGLESLPSNELNYQPPPETKPDPEPETKPDPQPETKPEPENKPEPKPMTVVSGNYNGLFSGEAPAENPGFFTLRKGAGDGFSGFITWLGSKSRFSGKFDTNGSATVSIARSGSNPVLLELHLDSTNSDRLIGTLSAGDWVGQLSSDRLSFNARTNPAPYVGKYTFAVVGILGEPLAVDGIGSGSVRVMPNGAVRASGILGDGKRFANSTFLAADGSWPFYATPYGRYGGHVSGWLKVETNGTDSIHGDLSWIKPSVLKDKLYPDGFTNSVAMIGSTYLSPTNRDEPVLNFSNATLTLGGGGLSSSLVKDLVVSGSKLLPAVAAADRLSVRIQTSVGLIDGRIVLPGYTTPVRFIGSVLQNRNAAYGLFQTTNLTGEIRIESAP